MTRVITDPKELYGFLSTHGAEVMNLAFASDEVFSISWKYGVEEDVSNLRNTKEVIRACVTAEARIRLYRYLERLRENSIYCHTDSMIYIQPRDRPQLIEYGNKFGDITSELRPSETIS